MSTSRRGSGMANWEIRRAMRKLKNFVGAFPSNHNPIPLVKSFPCSFIMNSNPVSNSGHWLAFYLISPTHLEFFDSLAHPLSHYFNLSCYFTQFTTIISNTRLVLQSRESSLCGEFCITFLHLRSRYHMHYSKIISLLHKKYSNSFSRDTFVSRFGLLNKTI